jgi:hypothetical protein
MIRHLRSTVYRPSSLTNRRLRYTQGDHKLRFFSGKLQFMTVGII